MLIAVLLVVALAVLLAPSASADTSMHTIGVSGHWVIEVREPDGTLATRREFHNALAASGAVAIAQLLAAERSTGGGLEVRLGCDGACCPGPTPGVCRIVQSNSPLPVSAVFKNLLVTRSDGTIQLRGFAVVSSSNTILAVGTNVVTCPPQVASSSCAGNAGSNVSVAPTLTFTSLSPPIPVVAGQQILVTVTIGFVTATPSPLTVPQTAEPRR
jgi:hypothetical protein